MTNNSTQTTKFCKHCGKVILSIDKFCTYCGKSVSSSAAVAVNNENAINSNRFRINRFFKLSPANFFSTLSKTLRFSQSLSHRKTLLYTAYISSVLIFVFAVFSFYLAGSFANLRLLPSIYISIWNNGWSERLDPSSTIASGSKEINAKPLPGITLEASENALDKTREFSMKEIPVDTLNNVPCATTGQMPAIIYKAFEFDGQMSAGERFPGSLDMTIDLEKQGIPKSLWQNVTLLHYNPESGLKNLDSQIDGNKISASFSHNGTLLLAVSLPFMGDGTAEIVDNGVLQNIKKIGGTVPGQVNSSLIAINLKEQPHFRLLIPSDMQSSNPQAVQKAIDTMNNLRQKYQLNDNNVIPPAPQRNPLSMQEDSPKQQQVNNYTKDRIQRMEAMKKDQEYIALIAETGTDEWIRKNFLPDKARYTLEVLEKAWGYLIDERNFKAPEYKIDTYLLYNMKPDTFAETCNPKLAAPLLMFNASTIPDSKSIQTEAGKKDYQELRATTVHELFHVITTRYYWYDSNSYIWFAEAAAVTVENEAKSAWKATWEGTARKYDVFTQPLDLQDHEKAGTHGYGVSYFFEYLRNKYYTANKDSFMTKLMTDFGSMNGSNVESLIHVTSNSQKTFEEDYAAFSLLHATDIVDIVPKEKLDSLENFYLWCCTDLNASLSNDFIRIDIPIASDEKSDPPILVITNSNSKPDYKLNFWLLHQTPSPVIKDIHTALVTTTDAKKAFVYLQRTNYIYNKYTNSNLANYPGVPTTADTAKIYVMRKPQVKPELSVTSSNLIIKLNNKGPLSQDNIAFVKKVSLTVLAKGDGWEKKEQFEFDLNKNSSQSTWEIPLEKLRGKNWKSYIPGISDEPDDDITYTVSYREIADIQDKTLGPESDSVSVHTQTGKQALIGSWNGKTTITDISSTFIDLVYEAVKEHQKTFSWWMNNPWAFQTDPEKYKQQQLDTVKGAKILIGKPFKIKMKFLQPDKSGLVQFYCQIINPELGEKDNEVTLFAGEGEWDKKTFKGDGFFPSHAYSIYVQLRKELRDKNIDKYIPNLLLDKFRSIAKKTGVIFNFELNMPTEQTAHGTIGVSLPFFSNFATFEFDVDKSSQENWPEFKGF